MVYISSILYHLLYWGLKGDKLGFATEFVALNLFILYLKIHEVWQYQNNDVLGAMLMLKLISANMANILGASER